MCFLTKEGQKTIKNIINWWFQSKTVSIWYALVLLMVILFPLKFNVLLFLPILEGKINFQSSIISCSSINYEAAALAGLFSSYPKIRLNLNKILTQKVSFFIRRYWNWWEANNTILMLSQWWFPSKKHFWKFWGFDVPI